MLLLGLLLSPAGQGDCWQRAAHDLAVPQSLLWAIVMVESGGHTQAWHRNHDGSEDRGLMQVNSLWWPRLRQAGLQPADLFDACTSLRVGAWILAQAMHAQGRRWAAIGAYHGGSPSERRRYIDKVYRTWQLLRGSVSRPLH